MTNLWPTVVNMLLLLSLSVNGKGKRTWY